MQMDHEPRNVEQTRIARIGMLLGRILRNVGEQLRAGDLNPHEGRLRSSVAPAEFLPKPPDFPPIHDDTLPK